MKEGEERAGGKKGERQVERLWQKYFTIRTELGLMIHPLELRDTDLKCRRKLQLTSGSHLALHLSRFCSGNCVQNAPKKKTPVRVVFGKRTCVITKGEDKCSVYAEIQHRWSFTSMW